MSKKLMAAVAGGAVLVAGAAQFAIANSGSPATSRRLGPSARASTARMCGLRSRAGTHKHVIVIFEENNAYRSIYGSSSAPYINRLMKTCGLATNYHNLTHPSLPNYIGVTSGLPLSKLDHFTSDCTPSASCESGANNIFHELEARGRSWKGYAESMPKACGKAGAGFYAPRHNPAVYYTDLKHCRGDDVPLGTTSKSPLLKALSSERTAPAFASITPNLCDDMHGAPGCPSNLILTGDRWLKRWLPKITSTAVYKSGNTAVLITWDEGEPGSGGEACASNTSDPGCHVVTLVVAPSVKPGRRVRTLFSHYSLLRTAEDLLGVPELRLAHGAASLIKPFRL